MLSLKEIEAYYPPDQRLFKKNILREYLQYRILEFIFDSKFAGKLSFLGGTAIRIIHSSGRFSEDMDFDNFNLTQSEFEDTAFIVRKKLELEGYQTQIKSIFKGAYHCYVKVPKLLYESDLSGHMQEKILIRIDTEPHGFEYLPDRVIINKFEVFSRINVVPADILLSQKLYAVFNRKRAMGRDIYDAIFLFGKTSPNFEYLKLKLNISSIFELKEKLLLRCSEIDFKSLAKDIEPFLIRPQDAKKILLFRDYAEKLK